MSNGETSFPRRTFFNYRHAIEELFSITIECDPSTYEYYIVEPEQSHITEWMLNASATSSVLQGSRDIADKILLEDVPSAREFLAPVIEALRTNHSITFDYHSYSRSKPKPGVVLEPYFLRIHRQLWYVTGYNRADKKVKTYSLDRMQNLHLNPDTFTPPADADPRSYFRDSFGVMVTQSQPKTIKLKVEAQQAKYFRALPLHPSQREMINDKYSVFTYRMRITSDLVAEILSHGPRVTVISPVELKTMLINELNDALKCYEELNNG